MNAKNVITNIQPATWHGELWREAFHTGNGQVGASVYGHIADETIFVSHGELYHWGHSPELPDISTSLQQTRDLMDQEKWREANWVSANMLKEKGYQGRVFKPCPLCDIKIHTETPLPFSNYSRTLNMETGEIAVNWAEGTDRFSRKTFVSRTHDVLCLQFEGTREITTKIFLDLHETGKEDTKKKREEVGDTLETYVEGDYIYYAAQNDDGTDFGAVARVVHTGYGRVEKGHVYAVTAPAITVFVKCFVGSARGEAFAELTKALSALGETYGYYQSCHAQAHGELFNSCDIQLSQGDTPPLESLLLSVYTDGLVGNLQAPALVEKLWRFGRYLLICGTRNLPFPLYGLWSGGYNLMWSHNMANENLQMMYWHTLCGGLEYTLKPVIDYYCHFIPTFQDNAKKLFGLEGIYVPAGTSPGMGSPNQIVPVIMNWTGAAGWLCQHFYNYYRYTRDEETLTTKILPFMEQTLTFYEQFVVIDEHGEIKIYPSVSPENTPENFYQTPEDYNTGHLCPTTINATMDLAILKELLTNMISLATEKNLYAHKIPQWEDMLARIPSYAVNQDGAMKEWAHPQFTDRYEHRHVSHIYPIFPGTEHVSGISDPDIIQAFETAVDLRVLGAQTGWSFSHMASIYARFGRPDKVMECLENLSRGCLLKNLTTLHNDWRRMGLSMNLNNGKWAPTQLDANMGIVNAVQEMLLFVSNKTMKILPALPEDFPKGSVKNMRFPYGRISFAWDVKAGYLNVEITGTEDGEIYIMFPEFANREHKTLRIAKGETYVC